MKIETTSVRELRPHPNNARTHSKKQIRQIAKSIAQFGFCNPVLVDDAKQIIAGHGRVEAAKLLGIDAVPTCQLSHLSEADKRAYVLADNKLAEKAGWDLKDVDLFELNEAFAVQAVAVLNELGIDPEKVNVNGGAVALGHAIGSSGGRVLTTLVYALKRRNLKRGIATLCLGGGNGVALAVERY